MLIDSFVPPPEACRVADSVASEFRPVAKYILYCLNEAGRIWRSESLDAASDEDALAAARAMDLPHGSEVWQRDRMVGRVGEEGGRGRD
jgi:hypothetical protein